MISHLLNYLSDTMILALEGGSKLHEGPKLEVETKIIQLLFFHIQNTTN